MITEEKKDFKKTELGVFPEEWIIKPINECTNYVDYRGATPKKVDHGITLVTAKNIKKGYIDYSESKEYVEPDNYDEIMSRGKPEIGDVLITTEAPLGHVAAVDDTNIALAQRVIKYRAIESFLDNDYLKYFFLSDRFQENLYTNSSGSTATGIKGSVLHKLPICFPPTLFEQQAIASALSDVDELIRSLDGLIQKKQAIKKGTMQQLLTGKKRLPGFDGEWEKISLKQLTDRSFELFNDGDWVESDHIIDQGIRLLQTGNVGVGKFKESRNKKYINEESFKKLNCKEVQVGDLLICRLADPPGRACIVPDLKEEKLITSVDVSILRPKVDKVDKHFLLQVFSTNEWFDEVNEKCGGTTRTRISRSALGNIELNLPPYEEQKAIGTIFKDMNQELQTIRQKREKYVQIKQGMMQELLTGKTRLV